MKSTVLHCNFKFSEWINPFPNKPWFLRVCSRSLLKALWEKEKLLVTSNFSFSHSVFFQFGELSAIFIKFKIVVCKLFQFGSLKFVVWERVKLKEFDENILNVGQMIDFMLDRVDNNIVGKGENTGYQHFLFLPVYFQKYIYTPQNKCFWGYTGISLSVLLSVCPSVYKILIILCHQLLQFCCFHIESF